jgi:tRNA (cmo5U34)-methyltransferase
MADYRWNQLQLAAGYDAAAKHIHPHYVELQDVILGLVPFAPESEFLLVDAGGGSGRLAEKGLRRFSRARVVVVDQSPAFLDLARRRLEPFGDRAACIVSRLQDDWCAQLPAAPGAIVSMSAIHHLDPQEKRTLYARCHDALVPGGVLMNGDEVRPEGDADYLAECREWAAHMHRVIDTGLVPPPMCDALRQWEERNVGQFGKERHSGDDCHETIAAQLAYYRTAGFSRVDTPWHKQMWAVLRGVKGIEK